MMVIRTRENDQQKIGITKQEEESAYLSLVQDIVSFSMKDEANFYMLLSVKTLLHKTFISTTKQAHISSGLKAFVVNNRDRLGFTD